MYHDGNILLKKSMDIFLECIVSCIKIIREWADIKISFSARYLGGAPNPLMFIEVRKVILKIDQPCML